MAASGSLTTISTNRGTDHTSKPNRKCGIQYLRLSCLLCYEFANYVDIILCEFLPHLLIHDLVRSHLGKSFSVFVVIMLHSLCSFEKGNVSLALRCCHSGESGQSSGVRGRLYGKLRILDVQLATSLTVARFTSLEWSQRSRETIFQVIDEYTAFSRAASRQMTVLDC